ncbi:MAG: polyphosphate kinase 2 [Gammaproteobacteria bacterium]
MDKREYKKTLRLLQIELVKLQRHIINENRRVLIIFEGRDASGKDGVIKRIVQHLSPRETRVVALGKPTERENRAWYFQRYVAHLPVDGELVLFNRSWYNRAGVEKVMGYCTPEEYESFMNTVNEFEDLLVRSGITLLKYYLNISRDEQKQRLAERKQSPLTQWKISPVDETALKHWGAYSKAHSEMIQRTHSKTSPWLIIHTDNKKKARLNVIRHILHKLDNPDKDQQLCVPDREIVIPYRESLPLDDIINT